MSKEKAHALNKPKTKLQKLRMERGFTQTQMARLMGVKIRTYITLEKSEFMHKREITQILRLCVILQCSISDLIEDKKVLADLKFLDYQDRKRSESDYVPESERDKRAFTKTII